MTNESDTAVELLQTLLRDSREPLHTIEHLASFLLDPSAGALTQHQKSVVTKIISSVHDLEQVLDVGAHGLARARAQE